MVRWSACLAACAVVCSLVLVPVSAASAAGGSGPAYIPPVRPPRGIITDRFRPPPTPYAAGNRGLDYATVPGSPIVASAAGTVVFAGQVGGTLHVTIAHPDGLRSSYSFLARVLVTIGEQVPQGRAVGVAGAVFHFGVRDLEGDYLDPELLFGGRPGAHLVPGPDDGAAPLGPGPGTERLALLEVVRDAFGRATTAADALAHEELSLVPSVSAYQLARELDAFRRGQRSCTPASVSVGRPGSRHIAVLVGGLGSTDTSAAIDRVDTRRLGYASGEVIRFSYAGGRVPSRSGPRGALASIPVHPYRAPGTEVDLRLAAARLVDLLDEVSRRAPGVPIDVMAHSQGGVVTRLALDQALAEGRLPARLGLVVTIATPHEGSDGATALAAISATPAGGALVRAAVQRFDPDLDVEATSLGQLSQVSAVTAELARPVPGGIRLLSIGASGDLTVPWVRTVTPGATAVLVHVGGASAHDRLPAAPATTRAIGLALAGRGPACVGLARGLGDVLTSHLAAQTEDGVGLTVALAAP